MKVRDIMTLPPLTCHLHTDLATASRQMRDAGAGSLVVLDHHGRVKGIVTDRDLAMALGNERGGVELVPVERAMTRRVYTCGIDDDVHDALAAMSRHRVRRLPVTSGDGDLKGVISIDDLILWAVTQGGIAQHALISALRRICTARTTAPEVEVPQL